LNLNKIKNNKSRELFWKKSFFLNEVSFNLVLNEMRTVKLSLW